jgi:1-acyl-sn-glycerol-3-phosphate acyltransferase
MHADAHVVAKAEVLRWPIVGLAGELIGTIYVHRDQKESRHQAVNAIQQALTEGISIIVFPEGTTTQGRETLPFRPRSFQAAAIAGVPVQPVAFMYADPRVAFIGDDTFIPHFFKLFSRKKIYCKIAFGPLLTGAGAQEEARAWIDQQLTPYTPAEVA